MEDLNYGYSGPQPQVRKMMFVPLPNSVCPYGVYSTSALSFSSIMTGNGKSVRVNIEEEAGMYLLYSTLCVVNTVRSKFCWSDRVVLHARGCSEPLNCEKEVYGLTVWPRLCPVSRSSRFIIISSHLSMWYRGGYVEPFQSVHPKQLSPDTYLALILEPR